MSGPLVLRASPSVRWPQSRSSLRGRFSPAAQAVLDIVRAYAARDPQRRLVMFGEVSHSLAEANTSWSEMGVGWEAVQDEWADAPVPSLFLTLDQWSHLLLSTVGIPHNVVHFADGTQRVIERHEYEALRSRLTSLLEQDWPAYIAEIQSTIVTG